MSCIVDPADIEIIRGNNYPPAMWQILESVNPDVIFPLDGSVFRLMVAWPGGVTISVSSDVNPELSIDLTTSIVTWSYSVTQSRALPLGRIASYELERWHDGTQQSLIRGRIAASEGLNPDGEGTESQLLDDLGNFLVDEVGNNITV